MTNKNIRVEFDNKVVLKVVAGVLYVVLENGEKIEFTNKNECIELLKAHGATNTTIVRNYIKQGLLKTSKKASINALIRYGVYLNAIEQMNEIEYITSPILENVTGIKQSSIRADLAIIGELGVKKKGYKNETLQWFLKETITEYKEYYNGELNNLMAGLSKIM